MFDLIGLCMVLRPRLSNAVLYHMGDPTNSQSTEGKKLQRYLTIISIAYKSMMRYPQYVHLVIG